MLEPFLESQLAQELCSGPAIKTIKWKRSSDNLCTDYTESRASTSSSASSVACNAEQSTMSPEQRLWPSIMCTPRGERHVLNYRCKLTLTFAATDIKALQDVCTEMPVKNNALELIKKL